MPDFLNGDDSRSTTGVHHTHRDYYSESSPIPSIQRFFKKGLSEVVAKRNLADSDSDSGEEDADRVLGSGGEPSELFDPQQGPDKDKAQQRDARSSADRLSKLLPGSKSRHESKDGNVHPAGTDEEDRPSGDSAHQSPAEADRAYKRSRKPRKVKDPVTGREHWIHDVGKREYRHTLARAEAGDKRGIDEVLRDNLANNLTSKAFPEAEPLPPTPAQIDRRLLPLFAAWSVLTVLTVIPAWISVILNAWLVWWGWQKFLSRSEDHRWERERVRGEKARAFDELAEDDEKSQDAQQGLAEGAEWLNAILEALWSVMNPELFSSLGGTLEDVMQASIPAFIHSVKVEDLAQGSTPIRITGLRILPDDNVDNLVKGMREERMRRATAENPDQQEHRQSTKSNEEINHEQQTHEEEEKAEHYVNLEIGFVYRARPTSNGVGGKSRNAHLLIKFWIGARKLLMIPLPVWVEIKGFVGKVRARVQLTSDPPFVKDVTITFCGLPRVGIEVVPLRINTSNIPFISSFIESSIDAAIGEFVMPSSLSMDVGEMLMGDNIKREVLALGVVVVLVHSATDLEKQDVRGSSDPYCTLSLAKVGKILYSTRVVVNELSPRWEERHVILVTREHLDSDDKVSIALWDSDRFSQDDILGQAEVSLVALAKHPNKLFKRSDTLNGLDRESTKQGIIHWSLGFFSKAPSMRQEPQSEGEQTSKRRLSAQGSSTGHNEDDAASDDQGDTNDASSKGEEDRLFHDGDELQSESIESHSPLRTEFIDNEKKVQTRNQATGVDSQPPDPSLPSGILSMQIHHIANLEASDRHKTTRPRRKNEPGQDVETVESEADPEHAPSAYCRIILNDEIIFQTRTKALNANPFYNAGTERYIRDWRRTLIMFVVYDFRAREADAILGVVPIKLSELFARNSQVTRFFPIAGGVGHGRIRLSLLFRPVELTSLSKNQLGWNIGTVRLLSSPVATDFAKGTSGGDFKLISLRCATLAGRAKIAATRAHSIKDGVEWKLEDREFPFKVPARRRYCAPYVIEFRLLTRTTHMCILWQQDLPDDEVLDLRLPIWRPKSGEDFHRLRQNYHDFRQEDQAERLGVERVGYLHVKMQFKSGLGKVHTKFNNEGARTVMDAWKCCVSLGLRSVGGDFAESRVNTRGYLEDMNDQSEEEPGEEYDSSDDDVDAQDSSPSDGRENAAQDENTMEGMKRNRSLKEKVADWKAEKAELHRQHKGLTAHKPVRTLEWVCTTVKSASAGLKDRFDLQDRRSQHVETEL
ncbi:C2 domain protein [Kalmanozyma brasiliensis GHG001]|uniref:Uncharacterized protein n=1 Tax=Kalmanozyma brasiliensis (strain GHG001) TaxID=1365824 RepID=V5GH12_KALBG|nr:C2 domain protein [Kalmanozyma brasiliensis GHG001]EST05302.1 C2 domain protein [Kalmanozyma brasiliensis GHG001]